MNVHLIRALTDGASIRREVIGAVAKAGLKLWGISVWVCYLIIFLTSKSRSVFLLLFTFVIVLHVVCFFSSFYSYLDIDECELGACINGECINTQGSYQCECPAGFYLRGDACFGSFFFILIIVKDH